MQFFENKGNSAYCNNIPGLLNEMEIDQYNTEKWRLFIDSSKQSFKCVLLHTGNMYGSIPIAHSVIAKETYESIKVVMELISYCKHQWIICVDLKWFVFFLVNRVATESIHAFYVFGIAELDKKSIGCRRSGQLERK